MVAATMLLMLLLLLLLLLPLCNEDYFCLVVLRTLVQWSSLLDLNVDFLYTPYYVIIYDILLHSF